MQNKTFVKEIFTSIQGEGPYIGYKQLFIRFTNCNLNCSYCDTDFKSNPEVFTKESLLAKIKSTDLKNIHSVSLTGGEPLFEADFLSEFLPSLNYKIYLETNGTMTENLKKIIDYVDIISMDIKLNSSSGNGNLFEKHKEFINTAVSKNKELFLKVVFDENITDSEILNCINLASENNLLIVLQPKMDGEILKISSCTINKIFNKFSAEYNNVRLIPQVHKFINVQ